MGHLPATKLRVPAFIITTTRDRIPSMHCPPHKRRRRSQRPPDRFEGALLSSQYNTCKSDSYKINSTRLCLRRRPSWMLILLGFCHVAWRLPASASAQQSLTYTATIPAGGYYSATCGWYNLQAQAWCNSSSTALYISPQSICTESWKAVGGGAANASGNCPSSSTSQASSSSSCFGSASCIISADGPNSVNLCVAMVNTGSSALLCDISISGSTAPDYGGSGGGLAWPVWQIVIVSIGGFFGLLVLVAGIGWMVWYLCYLPSVRVTPSPPPPVFDVSKVPLPGRYPATFMPVPQPGQPVPSPFKEDQVSYYLGYPAPQPKATFGPSAASQQPQNGWGGSKSNQLPPLTFYSQTYPASLAALQPAKIPMQ